MFSEKLDFIMKLTDTKASALGRACLLAPAHVSRLRSGVRPLPKRPAFLHDMSGYFARKVNDSYQKSAMCEALKLAAWPEDQDAAAALIESWFSARQEDMPTEISSLLASLGGARPSLPAYETDVTLPKARSYYYGPDGKREAVLQFFDLVLKENAPQTLCLSSDEEMGWLYEDPTFAALWMQRFIKVIAAGNRVKIIHSIGRDMNEMLEGVAKWLPIYATGAVEPYFYPRLRDGIFQRTLFLAPRTVAVTSVSVNRKSDGRLNELITDPGALKALSHEYEDYISLCRPLMQIITLRKREALWKVNSTMFSAPGSMICMSDMPTLATMPQRVAKAMQERAPSSDILKQWRSAGSFVRRLKNGGRYAEILPKSFSPQAPELPCADILGAPGLRYTEEEWQAHLANMRGFGEKHPGYTAAVFDKVPQNICLTVKEGQGVIMAKTNAPGVAFSISEANMVDSFWSYLTRL